MACDDHNVPVDGGKKLLLLHALSHDDVVFQNEQEVESIDDDHEG